MSNYFGCYYDWFDFNGLLINVYQYDMYILLFFLWYLYRFRIIGILLGISRFREFREIFVWDIWGNSWLVMVNFFLQDFSYFFFEYLFSCCLYKYMLEFVRVFGIV